MQKNAENANSDEEFFEYAATSLRMELSPYFF